MIAFATATFAASGNPTDTVIDPGENLQTAIDANPEGTTFIIKAGMHRLQDLGILNGVRPKNNNVFIGERGANNERLVTLSGAKLLTSFVRETVNNVVYWVATGQTQSGQVHGDCVNNEDLIRFYPPGTPAFRCERPEDLFFNDVQFQHVRTLSDVAPGRYYFDYDADKIYFLDDPRGKKVEVSTARAAFNGTAINVTVRGMIIEKFAIPAQMGAIGDQYPRDAWTAEDNEVRWNHGTGITVNNNGKVLRNYVHHNGQKGVGANGNDILIQGNEISDNNTAGFNAGWEAGGTKFALTRNLVVKENNVHHNNGAGLWTDIDNIYTLYENNLVTDNRDAGIFHEISFDATIRNNTVKNNGKNTAWGYGANIQISASSNVEVYDNTIRVGNFGRGISLIQQNRGAGLYGPYHVRNTYVHHNDVTYTDPNVIISGGWADYEFEVLFQGNNRFDFNRYHALNPNNLRWAWDNAERSWLYWRYQAGQDLNGTIDTNVDAAPIADSTYFITAKHSGKALDVWGLSTENGARIAQHTLHGGTNQRWILTGLDDGYYKLISVCSNKALEVYGFSQNSGAAVTQWEYWGGDNQRWKIEPLGNGYYKVTVKYNGKALDVSGVSQENGANIIQWDYHGGDNQMWKFEQVPQ